MSEYKDRLTDRYTDRQINRQTERERDRQTDLSFLHFSVSHLLEMLY